MDERGWRHQGVAALFDVEYSRLVGLAYVLTSDRELAEDLVQEAFARLVRGWTALRDPASAPAWLRSTLVNLARSSMRRRLVRTRKMPVLADDEAESVEPTDRVAVIEALRSIPYRQRVCVALRFYEGMQQDEIATVMGTSVGTVKSQTHKALKRLGGLLGEDT